MTDPTTPAPPTQAAQGDVLAGVIRHAAALNVQPDAAGVLAPLTFRPPGGAFGWQRVRVTNYTPYLFQVVGIPGGGNGDPPQLLAPFQQNVWPYYASRGAVTLLGALEGSPLAIPPLRFDYDAGPAAGELLENFVTVEWTDTPDLFFGYYPTPLTGIAIVVGAVTTTPTGLVPVGVGPVDVAVVETDDVAVVTNFTGNSITTVNANTVAVVETDATGAGPHGVAVDDVTGNVYVAATTAGAVDVFGSAGFPGQYLLIGTVAVAGAFGIAVDSATHKKYVTQGAAANDVKVLDAADAVIATIAVGALPKGIALNTVTGLVYVANFTDATVTVIDSATDAVVGLPIPVGVDPIDVAVDDVLDLIYVANSTDATVSVIDGATALVVATIPVGVDPVSLAANPVTAKVYVGNNGSNSVSVIDEGTATVTDTLNPGVGPTAVAVNKVTNKVFVTLTANVLAILNGV